MNRSIVVACATAGVPENWVAGGTCVPTPELAATIASHSPVGVRNAKAAMRLGFDTDLDAGLQIEDERWAATAFSADRAEGVAAFNEKRPPVWPGR